MTSNDSSILPEQIANPTPGPTAPIASSSPRPAAFTSILFLDGTTPDARGEPACFHDLNLDQLVDAVVAGKDEYDLREFFGTTLRTREAIHYRQDVVSDLSNPAIAGVIERFAAGMRRVREIQGRAAKLYYELQKQRYLLEAAGVYCRTIRTAAAEIGATPIGSAGLAGLRDYLASYAAAEPFTTLDRDAGALADRLDEIRYATTIYGGSFKVRRFDDEENYSTEILRVFAKFRETDAGNFLVDLPDHAAMDHIEAKVLEFVAALHGDAFERLAEFVTTHAAFQDPTLMRFDREVQFYLSYLALLRRFGEAGLSFCRPAIVETKTVAATATFDIILAERLTADKKAVVTNDFRLDSGERIFLVSGPNQGGKTTFARTFGQLHILGSLGLPVPGKAASLALFDEVFTHFEREEHVGDLRGKLEDEIMRVHDVLARASPRSIVIMNETFGSTTLRDATLLADRVLRAIIAKGLLCVCVTFLDELASLDCSIVSMVSEVIPDRLTERTFRIERRAPDGRSYAMALAEKHRLTAGPLAERLGQLS